MRILINRTDAIGDTILTLPMAAMIKSVYPESEIAFVISPMSKDLFENHPHVDEFFVFKKKGLIGNLRQIFKIYKKFSPSFYFYVGGTHLFSMVAFLKRVSFRGGIKSRLPSFLFLNKGVRQKRSYVEMHESEYNLNLLKPMGLNYFYQDLEKYTPSVTLKEDEKEKSFKDFVQELKKTNKNFDEKQNLIFIHPGMNGHTLNWPTRNYGRLVTSLDRKMGSKNFYVISHTPSDEEYVRVVRDELENEFKKSDLYNRVYFFNGAEKGLRHYMGVLSHADVFIGPSTGTTQLANILDVYTVAIFSPIRVQSALRWKPFFVDKLKVIVPDTICGEIHKCDVDCPYYQCMAKIEASDVSSEVQVFLDSKEKSGVEIENN